jgi:hypothetical protein
MCADPGAAPPLCNQCLPGICAASDGTCSAVCGASDDDIVEGHVGVFDFCDTCGTVMALAEDLAQLSIKVFYDLEQAEKAEAAASMLCDLMPPPFDVLCAFGLIAIVEEKSDWIVSYPLALTFIALNDGFCVSIRACPSPCSVSRSEKLALRAGQLKALL